VSLRRYAATVEVEGPQGVRLVDARSSDALNLAVLGL
jgi:bifunctional DNase/RNase